MNLERKAFLRIDECLQTGAEKALDDPRVTIALVPMEDGEYPTIRGALGVRVFPSDDDFHANVVLTGDAVIVPQKRGKPGQFKSRNKPPRRSVRVPLLPMREAKQDMSAIHYLGIRREMLMVEGEEVIVAMQEPALLHSGDIYMEGAAD